MTRAVAAVAATVLLAPAGDAVELPPEFEETVVLRGLTEPTALALARDGRVFVAEKSGVVKVFASFDAAPQVFADLRTQVFNFWDRGLLNLALHPDFPTQPYVYVGYTLDAEIGGTPPRWGQPGATSDSCPDPTSDGCIAAGRLSRLDASQNGAEQVLVENWCQQYPSHSLGGLAFGEDGALYVAGGEGASFNFVDYGQRGNPCGDPPGTQTVPGARGGSLRSQNLDLAGYDRATYGGKVLRIDPLSGAALPDNPLAGSAVPGADRIVARGLRQPFRMAARPGSEELWIAEVGWKDWEEINRIADGNDAHIENFGWPCFSGAAPQPGWQAAGLDVCSALYATPERVTPPVFSYAHLQPTVEGDGCGLDNASISGLAFESGGQFPPPFAGALFFADFSRRCIWALPPDGSGRPDPGQRRVFARGAEFPVDLEFGPDGELYYVDVGGGTVRRIRYAGGNRPPVASLRAMPERGAVPLTVRFDAAQSSDPDGDPLRFAWDLDGDGAFDDSDAAAPQHTYETPGQIRVQVRVTDAHGSSDEAGVIIEAGAATPPVAEITAPPPNARWSVGDEIAFAGAGHDAEDGALPAAALAWSIVLHHCGGAECHVHPLQSFEGVAVGSFPAPDHEAGSYLELTLTVTDSSGATASATRRVDPRMTELRIHSEPPGLAIGVNDGVRTAPVTLTLISGSSNTLSAPSPQTVGCDRFDFSGWSDGGAPTHTVIAHDDTVLTATFSRAAGAACESTPTPTAPPAGGCVGDCDGDGAIHIGELVMGVNVALGIDELERCPALDVDGDGAVGIDELVAALGAALDGCAGAGGAHAG